jgi:hypothetical protein
VEATTYHFWWGGRLPSKVIAFGEDLRFFKYYLIKSLFLDKHGFTAMLGILSDPFRTTNHLTPSPPANTEGGWRSVFAGGDPVEAVFYNVKVLLCHQVPHIPYPTTFGGSLRLWLPPPYGACLWHHLC